MKRQSIFVAACVSVFLTAPSVQALDYPVTYVVDLKQIKSVADGMPLTFELHASADCSAPFQSTVITAGDSALALEAVKTRKVKGGPKVPKEVHLRASLELTAGSQSQYFLKVTGAGVSPIGSDCQIQTPPRLRPFTRRVLSGVGGVQTLYSPECAADEVLTGGGCFCQTGSLEGSTAEGNRWLCSCSADTSISAAALCLSETYAICGNGVIEDAEQCEIVSDCGPGFSCTGCNCIPNS